MTGNQPQDVDSVNVYIAGDTGPSGFGVATRGVVRQLLEQDGININLRTHDVGFSRNGTDAGRMFPDTRFREYLLRNDIVNEDFLVEEPREAAQRDTNNLLESLNAETSQELMIRQWDGEPEDADVWIAFGGPGFAQHAPEPDDVHTIISTDFNLDVVPGEVVDGEKLSGLMELIQSPLTGLDNQFMADVLDVANQKQFEEYLAETPHDEIMEDFGEENEMVLARIDDLITDIVVDSAWSDGLQDVDEIWVPAQWVKDSIEKRYPEFAEKTYAMPYGTPMNYEPGLYDHENCPHDVHTQSRAPQQDPCLADDTFTFLVISRFYHIKGLYRTVKAFVEEFTQRDNVRLYVKTTSNQQFDFNAEAALNKIVQETQYPNPPEIGVGSDAMDTQHLYDLLGRADAFVQASRAECYGIAQFQAAYARTPVIYTNWSAQRELITEASGDPDVEPDGFIPLRDYEVERPEPEVEYIMFEGPDNYPTDSNWATPDVDALGDRMREVYELDDVAYRRQALGAREFVKEHYDWEDRIQPRVERIMEGAK